MDRAYIEHFLDGYEECALWSENTEDGTPLDEVCDDWDSVTPECREVMRAHCEKFCNENAKNLEIAAKLGRGPEYCGHDFWLTRNGHGTGFWDRDALPESLRNALSDACEPYGEAHLYLGDDGKVYHY